MRSRSSRLHWIAKRMAWSTQISALSMVDCTFDDMTALDCLRAWGHTMPYLSTAFRKASALLSTDLVFTAWSSRFLFAEHEITRKRWTLADQLDFYWPVRHGFLPVTVDLHGLFSGSFKTFWFHFFCYVLRGINSSEKLLKRQARTN